MTSEPQAAERQAVAWDEAAIDAALAACNGDPRATIRALLLAGEALAEEAGEARRLASAGYLRTRRSREPADAAHG